MQSLVSGTRPTGKLHLGHYLGVLRNWVALQNSNLYRCHFFVADWHALTTKYDATDQLLPDVLEVIKDFLSCGLNPAKSIIYLQSAVPEIAELHLLLSMMTPNNWVERDPTLKDLVRAASGGAESSTSELTYGMLGYPILQTADILILGGELVPVGRDQVAHLEMSREIARRFNYLYDCQFFPEPKALLTDTPSVPGIDGNKMSKSYNNDIKLSGSREDTTKLVLSMITDEERKRRSDPGSVERCKVPWPYYQILADADVTSIVREECQSAQRGCVDCKRQLAELVNDLLADIRVARANIDDEQVERVLTDGNARARDNAAQTMNMVRKLMKLSRA